MRWMILLALMVGVSAQAQTVESDLTTDTDPDAAADTTGIIRDARDATLDGYRWVNRPLVVFAESPADPLFIQQMQFIERELGELIDRDVIVLTDTDPSVLTPLREKLRPRGFMLVLVGKDGGVKFRKPLPWSVREISRTIDKMPIRQQEVRDRRAVREDS